MGGRPSTGRAPAEALPLAQDLSEPLSAIVRTMNHDSDNFISEMLLKELGASVALNGSTPPARGSWRDELRATGVPVMGVRIADGSGLSLLDRLTAQSLVGILRAGLDDPEISDAFVTSLAVAGISGTLERRLERRPARGRVIAKTGTTRISSALAGSCDGAMSSRSFRTARRSTTGPRARRRTASSRSSRAVGVRLASP